MIFDDVVDRGLLDFGEKTREHVSCLRSLLAQPLASIAAIFLMPAQGIVFSLAEDLQAFDAFRAVGDKELRAFRGGLVDLSRNDKGEITDGFEGFAKQLFDSRTAIKARIEPIAPARAAEDRIQRSNDLVVIAVSEAVDKRVHKIDKHLAFRASK
jgi:hypothetical protein